MNASALLSKPHRQDTTHLQLTCPRGLNGTLLSVTRRLHLQTGDFNRHLTGRSRDEITLDSGRYDPRDRGNAKVQLGLIPPAENQTRETRVSELLNLTRPDGDRAQVHHLIFGASRLYDHCRRIREQVNVEYIISPSTDITIGGKQLYGVLDVRNGQPRLEAWSSDDTVRGRTAVLVFSQRDAGLLFLPATS